MFKFKKEGNRPKENKPKKKLFEVPPIGVIDNIVITKKEAWAYYIISEKPYLFLSTSAKTRLAQQTITSIASLCQSANKKVDCHLLISNQPFNPSAWQEDIIDKYKEYNGTNIDTAKAFNKFIKDQAEMLYQNDYQKRITYLGVKLANRGAISNILVNPLEFGIKEAWNATKRGIESVFMFKELEITAEEEKKLRSYEQVVFNSLSASSLQAKRPSAEDILLSTKRRLYPAMPTPYLEVDYDNRIGLSDIVLETGAEIQEQARLVKITQMYRNYELTGYRATLSFSKFPKDLMFPGSIQPFLHRSVILPCTVNCRFSLIPTEEMKKKLYRKQQDTEDEINNLAGSDQRPTEAIRNTIKDQTILEKDLEEENLPWIVGNYRITIEAASEEDIRAMVENIKLEYSENDFVLTWTSGDQLDLLKEEFFGGRLLMKDFSQTTNLALIGLAGINFGGHVGDPIVQKVKYKKGAK